MKVKRVYPDAMLPTKGSAEAAGLDLYAYIRNDKHRAAGSVDIMPHKTYPFGSGLAVEIPKGYVGLLFARSGLGIKQQLAPPNCVGVIDSDYRGEIVLALQNSGNVKQTIHQGDRIAQLVVVPYLDPEIEEVDELSETERGTRGLGSTGV